MKTIEQLRDATYKEAMKLLKEHKKCAIIRPTGFGKTGILTRICRNYKNVLFLYPSDVVKEAVFRFYYGEKDFQDYSYIPGINFETFMSLVHMSKEDMKERFQDIDLIITDECHRLGGTLTYQKYKELIEIYKDVPRLGATATPDRMDLVDEIGDFFDNKVVSQLTLHDAISKYKIIKKPYYCFCSYGQADLDEVKNEYRKNYDKLTTEDIDTAEDILKTRLIEISNLQNMPAIVKECCRYAEEQDYIKFIVFFSSFEHMADKGEEAHKWFRDAFPTYTSSVLKVSSETKEYRENVYNLENLTPTKNHIDLIYCVDILNLGYHTECLTGIVMYRGTASGIIYQQQLGRILNSVYSGIVIDIVDNIHRKALYENLGKARTSKKKEENKRRIEELKDKQQKLKASNQDLSIEEQEELDQLLFIDNYGTVGGSSRGASNMLFPEDLIAIGNEATYRELIAKTVAEPISMRCRQAWARWKEYGGNDTPFFREYIVARGILGTPREGKDVPLWPFCEEKNVSVKHVLDIIGVPSLPTGEAVEFKD